MNRAIPSALLQLALVGFGSCLMQAQTTGSVTLTATISNTGAGPDHWTVVWVTDATTGAYVRTLRKQSNEPRGSHWNQHCTTWYAAANLATSATHFTTAPDGFTGATATTYSAPNSPFTQTWDCKDINGATIPDGTYRLWIQYAEDRGGEGPVTAGGLLWTKGPSASTVNPPNQGSNFTNMSIVWTPTGVVTAPEIAVEQPLGTDIADGGSQNFGSAEVGTGVPLTFTIRNTGNADLTGLTITKSGSHAADFTVTSNPVAPVAGPDGSTTFSVTFTPSATGTRTAAIHIANNDSNEAPFDINLSGTGLTPSAPEIAVEQPLGTDIADGGARSFGAAVVGTSVPLTFTILNTGTADLTGLTITKNGAHAADFVVTSNPVAPVTGPSGSTTFTVAFTPSAIGTRTAAIHIANNDGNEAPFDINLSGTGVAVIEPPLIVTHPASSGITSGQSVTLNVAAAGTTPGYQWFRGSSGDTSSPIAGATGTSYTTPALSSAADYWVRASNSAGSADSNTASITISSYVLSVSASHGTVSGGGVHAASTEAILIATPNVGYLFSGWSGDATGDANPLSVLMDSDKNIVANFSIDPATNNDPFAICLVGDPFEPRIGNPLTLDLTRLTNEGETIKVSGKLPSGLRYDRTTGLISGIITGKPKTYTIKIQILQGRQVVRTVILPIVVLPFPAELAGDFDAIIEDEAGVPTGALRVLITSKNSWTATLSTPGSKPRSAKGTCILEPGTNVVQLTASFPGSSRPPLIPAVRIDLSLDADTPNFTGSCEIGEIRGFRIASGRDVLPSSVACNLVFDAGPQDGIRVPAGLGTMSGTLNTTGSGLFRGTLGDGNPIAVSLRMSASGQCVLWAQPYKSNLSYIGGIISLGDLGLAINEDDKLEEGLWWMKAPDPKGSSYPDGFPLMPVSAGSSRWITPRSALELGASLGWRDNSTMSVLIQGAGFDNQNPQAPLILPQELTMDNDYKLNASLLSSASASGGDDDSDDHGDDDHGDDDDDRGGDRRGSSNPSFWSGSVAGNKGTFTGQINISGPTADGIQKGKASVSGVLVQDEAWGDVTGCGLVKIPVAGGKKSFRTAAFILGQ